MAGSSFVEFQKNLICGSFQVRCDAMSEIVSVANQLGSNDCKKFLIPFLMNIVDDDDGVILILLRNLEYVIPCIGGVEEAIVFKELISSISESKSSEIVMLLLETIANIIRLFNHSHEQQASIFFNIYKDVCKGNHCPELFYSQKSKCFLISGHRYRGKPVIVDCVSVDDRKADVVVSSPLCAAKTVPKKHDGVCKLPKAFKSTKRSGRKNVVGGLQSVVNLLEAHASGLRARLKRLKAVEESMARILLTHLQIRTGVNMQGGAQH